MELLFFKASTATEIEGAFTSISRERFAYQSSWQMVNLIALLFDQRCCCILSLSLRGTTTMPGKRAKILSAPDVGDLLVFASCTRQPLRNTVMVLLSAKAGLRAGEIANLTWDMIVDANGQVSGL
ncbi:MAG: hypothetical protein WAV78_06920, partial [Xanthobacteraceae bacterium]